MSESDWHFPTAHVRPAKGFVGDPNGPIWHRGRYHLFFQHNPAVPPRQTDVVWGHSSSPDLVNWQLHGIAISRSALRPEVEQFWSGNTVERDDRLIAFYSAQRESDPYQVPVMAVSDDAGESFTEEFPTVPAPTDTRKLEIFRDPYVWRRGDGWRMLIGSGRKDNTACVLLFESDDLTTWRGPEVFAELTGWPGADDLGSCWECPQYAWDLGVLVIAAWRPETGPLSVQALKGIEADGRFEVTDVEPVDHGSDFYAPSLMQTEDGRYLLWGWIWEGRDASWPDEVGWSGMLSLPRELSLENNRIVVRPARELEALRGELCYDGASSAEADLGEVPRAFELWLRLTDLTGLAVVKLECGNGEALVLELDADRGRVVVDRAQASTDSRAHGGRDTLESKYQLFADGTVEIRWFIDHSVSELFLAEGVAATTRFYPVSDGPWNLGVLAPGAGMIEARIWSVKQSVAHDPPMVVR